MKRDYGGQLAAWNARFGSEGTALWEELRSIYYQFTQASQDDEETICILWTLVVHLVHNFKATQRIRQPATDWPGLRTLPNTSEEVPVDIQPPSDVLRKSLICSATQYWLREEHGVKGFGVPTTSALCSLIWPDKFAITDRLARKALAAGTAPDNPVFGISTPFGELRLGDQEDPPGDWTHYCKEYLPSVKEIASSLHRSDSSGQLLVVERSMYQIGQRMEGIRKGRKRTWAQYREELEHLFWNPD